MDGGAARAHQWAAPQVADNLCHNHIWRYLSFNRAGCDAKRTGRTPAAPPLPLCPTPPLRAQAPIGLRIGITVIHPRHCRDAKGRLPAPQLRARGVSRNAAGCGNVRIVVAAIAAHRATPGSCTHHRGTTCALSGGAAIDRDGELLLRLADAGTAALQSLGESHCGAAACAAPTMPPIAPPHLARYPH